MSKKDLTLVEHLEELRKRIITCLVFLVIVSACSFPLRSYLLKILKLPASGLIDKLAFFSPQEAFTTYFKISVFSGLIASMPIILYQVWAFISPAIKKKPRKYSLIFIFFSLLAFALGCLFAYFLALPAALKLLLNFSQGELEPVISVGKYISFVVSIILCTGFVFEMPVLSFILSKLGIINYRFLRKRFKYAVLAIFILAAFITPTPDVFNMMLLAAPMLLLYEISIWIAFLAGPRAGKLK